MNARWTILVTAGAVLAACATAGPAPRVDREERRREVEAAERAFARSMADRDHAAFASLLAEEAVFLSERSALRGKQEVADAWKRFFEGREAPFSWEPDRVEVLDSGVLGLTSGPVLDPQGKRLGTFNSVWRRDADGRWRVVFDKGCPRCTCP